jgi:hypothetical protein
MNEKDNTRLTAVAFFAAVIIVYGLLVWLSIWLFS